MRPLRVFLPVLLTCTLSFCLPLQRTLRAQTAPDAAPNQADRVVGAGSAPVRLPGHVPLWAKASADLGAVPDSRPEQLTLGIARAPVLQAAFNRLLADQQNPASPRFHQWLTPEEIGVRYGATEHDTDAIAAWLGAQGFTVDSISPARTSLRASAPAAVVSHALNVQLHLFAAAGGTLQAPTAEPSVPAALAPVVSYVAGLADVPYYTDVHKQLLPAPASTAAGTPEPAAGTVHPDFTASDGRHFLFPNDFNKIYDILPLISAGTNGTGQKIAILAGSRLTASDLTTWENLSALPNYQPNYIVPPGLIDPGQTNDNNQDEPTLDFERAYGTAPGAKIDLIIAQNSLTFANTDTMLLYEVNTLRDPVLSLSFGVCEAFVASSYIQNEDNIYSQAAAQGISVFVSSGDSGVAGCETHGAPAPPTQQFASINADCASSYVTCVGGTQFSDLANPSAYWSSTNSTGNESALGYIPEGAFNEVDDGQGGYQIFASGGGPSTVIPKPSWQKGVGVPADGARDTPDVSFSSSSHDGYIGCLLYTTYDCSTGHGSLIFSGTSAAAPSMAGIAALVNQKAGASQGNLNPKLYRTAANAPADFHDVTPATSGVSTCSVDVPSTCNNSTPGIAGSSGGLPGYPLTVGYDLATGLGSLDVQKFVTTAALPAATIVLAAAPGNSATITQPVTVTATVSGSGGTPTGTVQFFANGVALGQPVALINGVATLPAQTFRPAGSYTIDATYAGDASFGGADATPLNLTITNPNAVASTTTLTLSATSVTSIQTVSFTATVTGSKGTATGTVQFLVDGVKDGPPVTLAGGSAALANLNLGAGIHSISAVYSGDDNYAASTSNSVSITSAAQASSTSITLSPPTVSSLGSSIVGTTVAGVSGGPVPTGTVTLYQGSNNLATIPLTNGVASVQVSGGGSAISPGTYPFYWTYSGDAVYGPSTSATNNLIVTGSSVTLAAATPNLTVAAGSSITDAITISSSGFAGPESLACAVTFNGTGSASNVPTCSLSPNSVTLAANGSASSTLTVSTTAAHAVSGSGFSANRGLTLGGLGGGTLATLLFGFLPLRGKGRRALRATRLLSLLLFLAGSLTLLSGCGSGTRSPGGGSGTTSGSYTVTITATDAGAVGGSVTIPLTVQ